MLVKTIHCKTERIITDIVKRTCRNLNSFNFQQFSIFMNDNLEYVQVLVIERRFCQSQINFPSNFPIYKLKINVKLQEKTLARWDLSIYHVPTVSCVNLRSQSFVFNVLISCHWLFKTTKKIESAHVSKLSKLINSSARYQNWRDMRFLGAGRLYVNQDVFSCAMVLLIIFLSKTRISWANVIATPNFLT